MSTHILQLDHIPSFKKYLFEIDESSYINLSVFLIPQITDERYKGVIEFKDLNECTIIISKEILKQSIITLK